MAFNGFEPFEPPAPLPAVYPEIGCNGICLTPADISLPEYSSVGVAYAHPDCPEHGGPVEDEPDPTYTDAPFDDPLDV